MSSTSNYMDESEVFEGIITPISYLDELSISSLPQKQGWLKKKTTGIVKRWIKRYFVLDSNELKYYYTSSKERFGGVIDFNILTIEIEVNNNEFKLITLGGKRVFKLRCDSEQEALDWVYAISIHVNASIGRRTIFPTASKSHFWKFNRISDQEFRSIACTGDLLLFRGKDVASKVQRIVTKSEYDHVAFILKYTSGKIGLLEATGAEGVSIAYWDDFMLHQWNKLYNRLVYRKLEFERNNAALTQLEEFIRSVYGKKYRISPSKLISNKIDKNPKDRTGFFCSELVATAYKTIGILPEKPPANKYWPGDFSDSKVLQFLNGAFLEPELLIDFDIR